MVFNLMMNSSASAPAKPGAADVAVLARSQGPLVFSAAYRVLGDAARAEDVQQEVFLRLLEKPPLQVDSWPAYLTAAATRAAVDLLRKQQRWWRILPLLRRPEIDSRDSTEDAGLKSERARQLRKALAGLGRREAQCFSLRYLQGMEIAQIAAALELNENTVSVALHRARRRLQSTLNSIESTEARS